MDSSAIKCEPPVSGTTGDNSQQLQQSANLLEQPIMGNPSPDISKQNESTSHIIIDSHNSSKSASDETGYQLDDRSHDSLTSFSTAFTISFGDNNTTSNKRLGIKDSIRKFAPPKPNTIEKSRERRSDCPDDSLTSVESAPAGLSKHFNRKGLSASSRSAHPPGKLVSTSKGARQSAQNVGDSVALLIDRMLCDQKAIHPEEQRAPTQLVEGLRSCRVNDAGTGVTIEDSNKVKKSMREAPLSDDICDSEIDFCDDKSDNGTYIVGADSESDTARKKIDELFGVVKSAEASVLAESRNNNPHGHLCETRQSRLTIKKLSNKERQDHINRLAPRHHSKSRSSSSSHQEATQNQQHSEPSRCSSRQSNHSSEDRSSRAELHAPTATITRQHRRSMSQSSRQSNNRNELSDADTRSSRSSLNNEVTEPIQSSAISNHSNIIKFNRTFDLRRKRLGLTEPNSRILLIASSSSTSTQQHQQYSTALQESHSYGTTNNLTSSQRRHQINSNTCKSSQINQQQSSSKPTNFCREDGGRFSLRMKNISGLPRGCKPNNAAQYNHSPQHSTYDTYNYRTKTSTLKHGSCTSKAITTNLPKYNTSTNTTYQSSDELETIASISSSSRYKNQMTKGKFQSEKMRNSPDSEEETESQYQNSASHNCFDSQQRLLYEAITRKEDTKVGNSANRLHHQQLIDSSEQFRPGLNSLMISSISSLSLKMCHSICDVLVELSKKLPVEDDTRLILEEIMPEVKSTSKSPTSMDEIESPHIYLARTLKNFRRIEQMVAVINTISSKIPPIHYNEYNANSSNYGDLQVKENESSSHDTTRNIGINDTVSNSDENS